VSLTRSQSDAVAMTAPALIAEVLQRFGEAQVRVLGTSMLPAIDPHDVLLVHRCSIERVAVGDIVLFAVGVRLFAHRVTQINAGGEARHLITKGDTHRLADPPVSEHELLGKIVAVTKVNPSARPRWWRRLSSSSSSSRRTRASLQRHQPPSRR
jgi:signal peptidase I